MEEVVCAHCNKKKKLEDFYNKKSGWCKDCMKENNKTFHTRNKEKRRRENKERNITKKQFIFQLKKDKCCKRCGYNKCESALEFHHLDPSIKEFNISGISRLAYYGWEKKMLDEISKCIILCSNCHREFHYLENRDNMTIEQFLNGSLVKLAITRVLQT